MTHPFNNDEFNVFFYVILFVYVCILMLLSKISKRVKNIFRIGVKEEVGIVVGMAIVIIQNSNFPTLCCHPSKNVFTLGIISLVRGDVVL
jgi:hypothetical protein